MFEGSFLDAIFMEQMEFGLDTVDNCFVLPFRVGSSGHAWMVSVPLDGHVEFQQKIGMVFRDYGDTVAWEFPGGRPSGSITSD